MTVHYVPAGAEGYAERRVQLQITNKPNAKESSEHGRTFKRWRTREKTITVVATTTRGGVHSDDGADLVVPILSSTFIKNCGLTKILANPIHGNFSKAAFETNGIESIVDSGGFQMLKGTVDFVDPDELVGRYNAEANIGMPLDLPVPVEAEEELWDPVGHMIRANDSYMLKKLDKRIDLALISHGTTLERRKSRLDILDRDAKVVAIAGLGIKPAPGVDHATAAMENFMYVIHRYHKTARYFHVLGITSKFWLFIYSLLDAHKYVQSIGADSVSHRLGSLVGMYDTYDFQTIQLDKKQTYHKTMPCNCPVCSSLDDLRLVNSTYILEAHNMWVRAQWTKLLSDMAHSYVKGYIKLDEVYKVLQLPMKSNDFVKLVRYVETIIETNKYKPLRVQPKTKSLFGDNKAPKAKHPKLDLYRQILTRYGKLHGKKFIK